MSTEKAGYHHGNLRETLVRTALTLLEESGVEALSLRAAARGAGVSAMAPYRHFADKAALLAAVADQGYADLRDRLAAADTQADPRQALVEQGVAYVRFACERPALFRLMLGAPSAGAAPGPKAPAHQPPGPQPPGPKKTAGSGYDILSARVAGLVAEDRRDTAVVAAWSLVHGLACLAVDGRLHGMPGGMAAPEALARQVTSLFTAGLVAARPPSVSA
ncbi:TetR/AcrR family transcriptional regulator [Nitrospirillum pindoramense]|uniref:TetR family transcriptional regulator n=1 Tax=Nitrospirillum amazonense TaxID=28077 RepID=A0A560HA55_9PROT|nr:TetR/AcrR family transcriptional regulator [Nitrospirillum amazonense]TWB42669.1 TetR family transcriptional regulator [Nitrospirillum amazonense]